MAEIVRLEKANADVLEQVNKLLRQLSDRVPDCTLELLKNIIENPMTELWAVKENDTIVGMGELAVVLKPEGVIAQIEDVVVDEEYRNKGLGEQISQKLVERARVRGARVIQLSSRSTRTAANALYKKLGFVHHETNSYYLKL